jgi:hypothetical protein
MTKELKTGTKVSWETSQGTTEGKVVKKLTKKTNIRGHEANPSEYDPQYLVKSSKTGKTAAHKPEALKKIT